MSSDEEMRKQRRREAHELHPNVNYPGKRVAYRGREGCRSVICTRLPNQQDRCYGWHCATCHQPCSCQGHRCPERGEGR